MNDLKKQTHGWLASWPPNFLANLPQGLRVQTLMVFFFGIENISVSLEIWTSKKAEGVVKNDKLTGSVGQSLKT